MMPLQGSCFLVAGNDECQTCRNGYIRVPPLRLLHIRRNPIHRSWLWQDQNFSRCLYRITASSPAFQVGDPGAAPGRDAILDCGVQLFILPVAKSGSRAATPKGKCPTGGTGSRRNLFLLKAHTANHLESHLDVINKRRLVTLFKGPYSKFRLRLLILLPRGLEQY